jgi:hypothetical protein
MNAQPIIVPTFYMATVNYDRYERLTLTEFFMQLTEEDCMRDFSRIQQLPTQQTILTALEGAFGDRVISHGLWPAHSPYLTPYDFYLWGNLKDNTYRINPHTKEE